METLEKLSTLNEQELLKLELNLRQQLITSPGQAESEIQAIEKKFDKSRTSVAAGIEKTDSSVQEMRRAIASKRLETKKCREAIEKRKVTNEELRRQIERQRQAAREAQEKFEILRQSADESSLPPTAASVAHTVSADIVTTPVENIEKDSIGERLKLDEVENNVRRLRDEHQNVMAALDTLSVELTAVMRARGELHRLLEKRESAQSTFEAARSAQQSADAAAAIKASQEMSKLMECTAEDRRRLCDEVIEVEGMIRHLSEGVQERTAALHQQRKKSFAALNDSAHGGSVHHSAGDRAAFESLLAENSRLRQGLLDVLKESASERVAQVQFGGVLRDRIVESCVRLQQELYELEIARNIQSGAIRRAKNT